MYKVTIEETISQEFRIEDAKDMEDAIELAEERYRTGKYVVGDNACLTGCQMQVFEENDDHSIYAVTEWWQVD